ncbi:GNAT family N-acetyltransferase [Frigoribacterium sp. UYMn621]|uniref:GNAT family N-acetyltransferase n=1 Tax=Frigoribacterium sp. UYMn621 TaxID=3156343 RepID=UPI00339971D1
MIVRQVPWSDVEATTLREAQRVEVEARYGTPDSEPGPAPSADDITAFFVAYDDSGVPLGCGGLRELPGNEAEVKRMFVMPAHRGTGVSRAILLELELFGRERGWSRLLLETGDRQPDAVRFYEREGFTRIPNFAYYADSEHSLCYEKSLFAVDPASEISCEGCQ